MSDNECGCNCFHDILAFRKLIVPPVVRVLFWIGSLATVLGGLRVLMRAEFVAGLLLVILGPIAIRLVCELLLIGFKNHDLLVELRDAAAKNTRESA